MGLFELVALFKLMIYLVIAASGLFVVKTLLGWFVGGAIGFKASKLLNAQDKTWTKD